MKKESLFNSMTSEAVAYRLNQMKVDNFIEGIVPDKRIKRFVHELDQAGVTDTETRIKMIGDFIQRLSETKR